MKDHTDKIKVVSQVSDPRPLSAEDLSRIEAESKRLYEDLKPRIARMETLTADDLKIRLK